MTRKHKHLRKSIAGAIVLATMLNGCININANETNNNKLSNVKKCLKCVVPVGLLGTALFGGFILGTAKYKKDVAKIYEDNERYKKNKYLKLLDYIDYNSSDSIDENLINEYITDYLENDLGNFVKKENIPTTGENVINFDNFCSNIFVSKKYMIDLIKDGKILVFRGNIVNKSESSFWQKIDMRNFLFVTILQQLSPNQVVILKGQNERYNSYINNKWIPQNLASYMYDKKIRSKKAASNIEKFFYSLDRVEE